MLFASEEDARRVLDVLPKRFAKYGLALHPEKTRLVEFRRPDRRPPDTGGAGRNRSGTFDLLGFTHYWGLSRKGKWVVKRKTAKDRLARSLKRATVWCRLNRHRSVREQWQSLRLKLQGHYGYFGTTGNFRALQTFYRGVQHTWRKWLDRRSQRSRMPWERMHVLLRYYPLPPPRIMHSTVS